MTAGSPAEGFLPIIRPTLPPLAEVTDLVRRSWDSGMVTLGSTTRDFEEELCRRSGVRHAVAMASCTAGLMLVPRALGLQTGREVIVPSFTFAPTAQALLWNGLVPVFCDCLPGTRTLDPADVERNLSSITAAICPVYVYGLPPDVDELLDVGRRHGVPVYFDSAQGLGATYRGYPAGDFGACEVFSLSPTKVVTAIEGGVVTTSDDALAGRLRAMRDYGKDPTTGEDMVDLGLSARMGEFHAAVGLASLRNIDALVKARLDRIARYRERLAGLRGCAVQSLPGDRTTSGNYFVLFISATARRSRDEVHTALAAAGIQTKRYFSPPLHEQTIFRRFPKRESAVLRESVVASREGLALPLYSHMRGDQIDRVCQAVEALLG
jgi:dTDP-4-amino-4,6-dideoxygalactose transaminase